MWMGSLVLFLRPRGISSSFGTSNFQAATPPRNLSSLLQPSAALVFRRCVSTSEETAQRSVRKFSLSSDTF